MSIFFFLLKENGHPVEAFWQRYNYYTEVGIEQYLKNMLHTLFRVTLFTIYPRISIDIKVNKKDFLFMIIMSD